MLRTKSGLPVDYTGTMASRTLTALPLVALSAFLSGASGSRQDRPGIASPPAGSLRLSTNVTPEHYDLTFVVDLAHARFEGTETIRVQTAQSTPTIVLHALDIDVHEATVRALGDDAVSQTAQVSFDQKRETATLAMPRPIGPGPADVHIRYTGRLNDKLRGFYLSKGKRRDYAVTQFESTDARRAFPCFDEPAFKATFDITLVVNRGDTAISNGRLLSDIPGPSAVQHTMKFATSPKMSTYLVAMAVGDFQCLAGAQDNVPIRICATPDKKDLGQIALESAQYILRFYDTYFSIKYPYGKLDVVAVPDFAAGAMENTAAIFYRETDLLADTRTASVATRRTVASVLAHEMAHQWFGDLVTMEWWDDIWLNEGFATWMANHPLAAWKPEWNVPVQEAIENQTALDVDSLKSTRPIHTPVETPSEIEEVFDPIAYEKGAAVLRMIESYVGHDTFRIGVNEYLQAHAYANATSADFWSAIARVSHKPVDRIMPTFVNQPGPPLIGVTVACDERNGEMRGTFAQTRFHLDPGVRDDERRERWLVPICIKPIAAAPEPNGAARCTVLEGASATFTVAHGCHTWAYANEGARGYYRTEYSPAILTAMSAEVETALTPPERLSLIGDEWALVRARRHSIADYLTIASGFAREHSSGVLSLVEMGLHFANEYLTTDAIRPRFEAYVSRLFHPLLDEVGFTPAMDDPDERRELRATLIEAVGTIGGDPEVVARSRATLDRALAGGARLDATIAGAIVRIAAQHGDAKLYDALLAAAGRATEPQEHYRYLFALAEFRDPALIDRGLRYAISPQLRSQDTASYLARFMANPFARDRAWSFVKTHWTDLQPKIAIAEGDTTLVSSLSAFCDNGARADVASFFGAHTLPVALRTLEQTLEWISNCVALRESQTAALQAWLMEKAGS
jgi:aminopeptidase N